MLAEAPWHGDALWYYTDPRPPRRSSLRERVGIGMHANIEETTLWLPLRGPNDFVFDAHGGFWFTDFGKTRRHDMDRGCVCYAKADGSTCYEVIRAMMTPNGVGLSPDGTRLYVAETIPGRVWWWEITAPGQVRIERTGTVNRGHLLVGVPGYQEFDSLAVDSAGYVCVATLHNGGITLISPDGNRVTHVSMPDPVTTNICFGGPGLCTAYITL